MRKALLALLIIPFLTACPASNQKPQTVADYLTTARSVVVAAEQSAPDLVKSGDLTQADADWIAHNIPAVLPYFDTAISIASGKLQGDPLAQLDLALNVLRQIEPTAPPKAQQWLSRLIAGVVVYRNVLAAQVTPT